MVYDQYSGHFYAIADLRNSTSQTARIYVARSNTSDPNQGWNTVYFSDLLTSGATSYFGDYPTLAVDQFGLYITANYFPLNEDEETAPSFVSDGVAGGSSSRLFMLSKDITTYYTYDPAVLVGLDNFTLQPAHTYGNQSAAGLSGSFFVAYQQNAGNDTLYVTRINNAISGSATFSKTAVNVGNISDQFLNGSANVAPQRGSSTGLNVGDNRVYSAVWRDGILYATTEITLSGRAVVHWFKINTSTMALLDQGNVTADDLGAGTNTYYGNIAVNNMGQFAIGFAASNPNIFVGAYYAVHGPGDPAGTMEGTQALRLGQNSYVALDTSGRNRWGDYSGTAVDPADDRSFWFFNEYSASTANQWASWIGEISSSPPQPVLFSTAILGFQGFGSDISGGGWTSQTLYPRQLADVDGDGKADIVGFGSAATYVSLATGGGNFASTITGIVGFGSDISGGGWTSQTLYPRQFADVNGDGKADIVGFGSAATYVSLATGGGNFTSTITGIVGFGADISGGGWTSQDLYPRQLADVNGDGKADIVAFGAAGVYVSLATGGGLFGSAQLVLPAFGSSAGGWMSQDQYPRLLADVNGDHMADIIAFGADGVYESLAAGGGHFGSTQQVLTDFGSIQGWTSNNLYPRLLGDVNHDGQADIVGFFSDGIHLALAGSGGGFNAATQDLQGFGTNAGGWSSQNLYPRVLGDVSGDGRADILGFGSAGAYVSLATNLFG